jgi:hypothetical protein
MAIATGCLISGLARNDFPLFEASYAAQRAGQLARQDPRDRLGAERLRRQRGDLLPELVSAMPLG